MSAPADMQSTPTSDAVHVKLLRLFTGLFALRVAAQLAQYASPMPFLPPFEAWQGSELDYPVLLAGQLAILVIMLRGTKAVSRGVAARPRAGAWLTALGWLYFGAMSMRLVLGLTVLSAHAWFAEPLPALFHLVLAGYVLTVGHYHSQRAGRPRARG